MARGVVCFSFFISILKICKKIKSVFFFITLFLDYDEACGVNKYSRTGFDYINRGGQDPKIIEVSNSMSAVLTAALLITDALE